MSYTYEYPRPGVTADIILITKSETPKILLIERKHYPFEGNWALPGGFVEIDEDIEIAALRELKEETNLEDVSLTQFKTYGAVDRDPRGRTISVVYYGFVDNELKALAGDDASEAKWYFLNEIPKLAFDHDDILKEFIQKVL